MTFTLDNSPDSAPYPINGVLRDRRQSESESVIKASPLGHGVPTSITSYLFIGFESMSNGWKVEIVN
jgi:hypothetical protein